MYIRLILFLHPRYQLCIFFAYSENVKSENFLYVCVYRYMHTYFSLLTFSLKKKWLDQYSGLLAQFNFCLFLCNVKKREINHTKSSVLKYRKNRSIKYSMFLKYVRWCKRKYHSKQLCLVRQKNLIIVKVIYIFITNAYFCHQMNLTIISLIIITGATIALANHNTRRYN